MKIAQISVSDWRTAVAGMTLEEEGFFWRMVCLMYTNDAPFLDDDHENARIMGGLHIKVYRRLKAVMLAQHRTRKPVIEVIDGHLVNERALKEIEKYCAAQKQASEAGKSGAKKRWSGRNEAATAAQRGANGEPTGRSLASKEKPETNEINDLGIASPFSILHTPLKGREETPLAPQGGWEERGKSFVTREAERAEREAKAAEEVAAMKAPKGEINPYRPQNHNYAPDADPEQVGIGWTEGGDLQVFNGCRKELLELSGDEQQLKIDLLTAQRSRNISPGVPLHLLKSRVKGIVAGLVDSRYHTNRRYAEACARNQKGRGASGGEPTPQEVMSSWAPTTDETILRERFAWFVTKTKGGKDLLRNAGQKATWESFRDRQLERAREPA